MKKALKKITIIVAAMGLLLSLNISMSFASSDAGYTTDSYNVNVIVTEDHRCAVTETITVDFKTPRHGIYRYIPYQMGIYKITDIDVENEAYDISSDYSDGTSMDVIQIGDADTTITGKHTYRISYVIAGFEDKDQTADYFSLDVLPTGWQTDIKSAKVTVTMPKDIDWEAMRVYSGTYGSVELASNVNYSYDKAKNMAIITGKNMEQGSGITLQSTLPNGYWVGAASNDWAQIPLTVILATIPILAVLMWLKWGRDPKIVKTVEFYPPEGMTPAEIGYVVDDSIDTKDMVSLIMYLAEKGYITIKEIDGKKDKFQLEKVKDIDKTEKSFVKTFFNGLFVNSDKVMMDSLPDSFGDTVSVAQDQLSGFYSGKNRIFSRASKACRGISMFMMMLPPVISVLLSAYIAVDYVYMFVAIPVFIVLGIGLLLVMTTFDKKDSLSGGKRARRYIIGLVFVIVAVGCAALATGLLISKWWLAIEMVASMIVTYLMALLMKARTKKSAELQGKILGFKNFIKTAELDKLKALVDEDPEYFYNVMPYAYVFGLSDKWAKKFENIPMKNPNWYYGNSMNSNPFFTMMWWNSMSRSCYSSMAKSMLPDISSDDIGGGNIGGGFGGGGFSGGGFGGGGGGAW